LNWRDFKDDGMRFEIFGQSGSGKSHAAKVILEEFLKWNIPSVIIDPEGEYISIKEITRTIIVGGVYKDVPLDPQLFQHIVKLIFTENVSVIFDLSEVIGFDERSKLSFKIQKEIFNAASKFRKIFVYLVDEAKLIAPQILKRKNGAIAADIAQRGRKRGFIPIFVMQRPSEVEKGVLTQCNIHIMGRLQFPTDLNYIKNLLSDAGITIDEIKNLSNEFFVWRGGRAQKIRFRPLRIKDLGKTIQPGSTVNLTFKTDKSLDNIVESLEQLLKLTKDRRVRERNLIERLEHQLSEQEKLIFKLQKELEIEKQANQVIKKIDFQLENPLIEQKYRKELNKLKNQFRNLEKTLRKNQISSNDNKLNSTVNTEQDLIFINLIGINKTNGRIVGDSSAKILLDLLNPSEREIFFLIQGKRMISKTKILQSIKGKGERTINPILRKLEKFGFVKKTKRGHRYYFSVIRVEEIDSISFKQ